MRRFTTSNQKWVAEFIRRWFSGLVLQDFSVTYFGSRSVQLCDTSGSLQRLRLKQQGRLIPLLSLSSATSICFWRVSAVLTARIQRIQSQRASGVISFHRASALREVASAFLKSSGTSGSIHSLEGSSETCTVSPAFAQASSSNVLSGLNQWLDC